MEGPFFEGLSRIADLVILNLLFIACCIPVVTIGASVTGLSYVMLKIKYKEEGYLIRSFFHSFRQNFKQATLIWLGMLVAAFILYVDMRMLPMLPGMFSSVMRVLVLFAALLWVIVFIYIFPLLARFENTSRQMLANALLLAIANAPKTLLMAALLAGAVVGTFANNTTFVYGMMIWILTGFSLIAWINAAFLAPIFRNLEGGEKTDEPVATETEQEAEAVPAPGQILEQEAVPEEKPAQGEE